MSFENIYYGLQLTEDILYFYSSITYCHNHLHYETSEGLRTKTQFTNTIYKQPVFLSCFALRFISLYKHPHTTYTDL